MVASERIELPTRGSSVPCSTNWATKPWRFRRELNPRSSAWQADVITATLRNQLVAGAGFEPTTFGLWARRATKLLHPAISVAEKEGFEPPRRCRPPGFQDRSLQPDLGISPRGAWGRTWTGTGFDSRRILSPVRLPISPLRHVIKCSIRTEHIHYNILLRKIYKKFNNFSIFFNYYYILCVFH